MTQPAARVGDPNICPDDAGAILPPGCPTVLIGGLPAARIGDQATCGKSPDTIVKGEPTVLIGGQPAARMGDSTAQGGVIVAGCPTVLIGADQQGKCLAAGCATGLPLVAKRS